MLAMDDLGEPEEHYREQFRFLPSPVVSALSDSDAADHLLPKQPLPNNVNLLAASSTYGYAFAAIRNFVYAYSLSSLRTKAPDSPHPPPVAKVDLQNYILGLHLVNKDSSLIVHTRKDPVASSSALLSSLNVYQLTKGNCVTEPWLPSTPCTSYAVSDQTDEPFLAIISPQKLQVFKSNTQLWSSPTEEREAPICISFSLDGSKLAVGTRRGSIKLHDTNNGSLCGSVKEVESGWIPVSVAFIAQDDLFVCYQNEMLLSHVVWRIPNGEVQNQFALGDLFYLADDSMGEREVYSYCYPIKGWNNIAVVANSCSEDVKIIAHKNNNPQDGWLVWNLDDGLDATFPLDDDENQSFPVGFVLDYSDNNTIPNAPGRPARNPMPRFIAITNDYKLWSVSIVDDVENAVCESIKDSIALPISSSLAQGTSSAPELLQAFPPPPDSESITSNDPEAEPKSVSTDSDASQEEAAEEEVVQEIDATHEPVLPPIAGAAAPFMTSINPVASLFGNSTFQNPSPPFAAPVFKNATPKKSFFGASSSSQNNAPKPASFTNTSKETSWENRQAYEVEPPVNMFRKAETNQFLSNFNFGGATGQRDDKVTANSKAKEPSSVPLQLASEPDPVNQLKSILIEMEEEIANVCRQKDQAVAMVEHSKETVEKNLKDIQEALSNLTKVDSDAWKREKEKRREVDSQVKEVIHNGHIYEELNLLNALLSENDDARPLPNDAQEQDRKLNRKEMEIMDRLEDVERKIEEKILPNRSRKKLQDWDSPSEMSQHIYSSLSLQGVRIKRVKAMLESLDVQLKASVKEDENRVAKSGLSRSRLERLSQVTSGPAVKKSSPASKRNSTPIIKSSPSASSERTLTESVQKLSLRARNSHSTPQSYSSRVQEQEIETGGVRADTAAILRKLAMRKGRERITVRKRPPKNTSGVVGGNSNKGSTLFDKKDEAPRSSFTKSSAPNAGRTPFSSNPTLVKKEPVTDNKTAGSWKSSPPTSSTNRVSFAKPPHSSPPLSSSKPSSFAASPPSSTKTSAFAASPSQGTETHNFGNFAKTAAAASFDIGVDALKKPTFNFAGPSSTPPPLYISTSGPGKTEEIPIVGQDSSKLPTPASKSSSEDDVTDDESSPEIDTRDSKRRWTSKPSTLFDEKPTPHTETRIAQPTSPEVKTPAKPPAPVPEIATLPPDPPSASASAPGTKATAPKSPLPPVPETAKTESDEEPSPQPEFAALPPDPPAVKKAVAKTEEKIPPPPPDSPKKKEAEAEPSQAAVDPPKSTVFSFSAAAASTSGTFGFGKNSFGGASAPATGIFAANNDTPSFSTLAIGSQPGTIAENSNNTSSAQSSSSLFGASFGGTSAFGKTSSIGQQSAFGQSSSLFGKPDSSSQSSIFGQTSSTGQASTLSAFGQSSSAFGTTSSIGQASTPSAFGQSSTIGQASTLSAFGQSSNIGQASTLSTFGQSSNITQASTLSAFGQAQTASAFGQTSTLGKPAAFGQTSGFGQASTIGQPSGFGQASTIGNGGGGFGASATFGSPSTFGASSAPLFGGASPGSAPLFGGSTTPSKNGGFGAAAASQGSPFGNVAAQSGAGFGAGVGGSPFGAMGQQNEGGFGSGFGGGGGSGSGNSGFGAAGGGQQPSGFGGGGGVFGQIQQPQTDNTNNNQFKSASFTQRRA